MDRGRGHFKFTFDGNMLTLTEYTSTEIDEIKEKTGAYNPFLLNARYVIEDGTLFISGDYHKIKKISINASDWVNNHEESELDELRKIYHIPKNEIIEKPRKNWYGKVVGYKTVLDQAGCLTRKGEPFTVKTTLFRIVELGIKI